ncbi:transglutaminase family protein [Candidatus Sumerlaeota bacterium]|nr:transglutaminase family protein [Candidatus Sumerlaeota bacterium]
MITLPPDSTLDEFRESVSGPDEEIDLARASLLVAKAEYPNLETAPILESLHALAARVVIRCGQTSDPLEQIEALTSVVLRDLALRGATDAYYDPRNSFINDVLERKVGIPISLSIIYMCVGARAGVALGGTSMPMHFLIRVLGLKPPQFVDCYNGGRVLTKLECEEAVKLMSHGKIPFREDMLEVISNASVLTRLLTNLKMIYLNQLQYAKAIPIFDRLVILNPYETVLLRERGIVRYKLGQGPLARQDLQDYLETAIEAPDADEIRKLLRRIG